MAETDSQRHDAKLGARFSVKSSDSRAVAAYGSGSKSGKSKVMKAKPPARFNPKLAKGTRRQAQDVKLAGTLINTIRKLKP